MIINSDEEIVMIMPPAYSAAAVAATAAAVTAAQLRSPASSTCSGYQQQQASSFITQSSGCSSASESVSHHQEDGNIIGSSKSDSITYAAVSTCSSSTATSSPQQRDDAAAAAAEAALPAAEESIATSSSRKFPSLSSSSSPSSSPYHRRQRRNQQQRSSKLPLGSSSSLSSSLLMSSASTTSPSPVIIFMMMLQVVALVATPPVFIHEPNPKTHYYVLDSTMDKASTNTFALKERRFDCEAKGVPEPAYRWEKNGAPFNLYADPDRITAVSDESGSFVIKKLRAEDEGRYQCFAYNSNGTVVDRPVDFKRTWIKYFEKKEPMTHRVELGEPHQVTCRPPESEPPPKVYWILMGDEKGTFQTLNQTHISINDKGTIFFHYVRESDAEDQSNGLYFTCTAENPELKDYKFGNKFRVDVLKGIRRRLNGQTIAAKEQYISDPSKVVVKGEDLNLFCFFSGYPVNTPEWYKDGKRLVNGERIRLENFGKSIVVSDVEPGDEGRYECRFRRNSALNRQFQISVEAAPYWADGSRPTPSQNASDGMDVVFEVPVQSEPTPVYEFYKNGKRIRDGDMQGRVEIDGNKLKIKDIRRSEPGGNEDSGDNAVYQALVNNSHGSLWTNFYLNLLSFKPIILDLPTTHAAVLKSDAIIKCKVFGSPMPEVTWTGLPLNSQDDTNPGVDAEGVSTLLLKSVSRLSAGEVACNAKNKLGEDQKTTYLQIREATRLVQYPSDQKVTAGQRVEMPCKANHDENLDLTVKWLIEGAEISEELLKKGHYILEPDNTLVIPEVTPFDSTKYTCVAKTELDKRERTATLTVRDVPNPPFTAWSVCSEDQRSAVVKFQYNEPVDTEAKVEEFYVQYRVDENEDQNNWITNVAPSRGPFVKDVVKNEGTNNQYRSIESDLTVPLSPYGKYMFRVFARNEVGDSAPFNAQGSCITDSAAPERNPHGVRVEGNTPDNLVVYWDPMEREEWNGPGFHYVVKYRPEDGGSSASDGDETDEEDDGWETVTVGDPYEDHVVINNDIPMYEKYEVRVQAVNDEGVAVMSPRTVEGFSGQGVPRAPPTGFALVDKSATSATFKWDPVDPGEMNGELSGYKVVHWYEEDDNDADNNEDGQENGRRRYKRQAPAESGERQEAIFDASSSGGTVYGMKPNRNNKAYVVVFNGNHDGPPSETISIQMPEGSPTPIRALTGFPLSESTIGLMWHPPRETNGELLGYEVEYCQIIGYENGRPRVNTNNCPMEFVNRDSNHFRARSLQPDTEYRFKITGQTQPGLGDPNSIDVTTLPDNVPQGVPAQPGVRIPGVGGDHINVTWIPGEFDQDDPKPIGDRHFIKYKPKDADEWQIEQPTNKNFTVQLMNLDPGTMYEIVSVSVTEDENGQVLEETESPSYYVTTTGQRPTSATAAWLIVLIVAIIILIIILIIVCLVVRNRGAKYPVSEKEREQGREPMLGKEEKGFGEYTRPDVDEEKRSLTGGSIAQSETDSMAEYGDAETGGFAEDGSFIGQYVNSTTAAAQPTPQIPPQVQYAPQQSVGGGGGTKTSTFV